MPSFTNANVSVSVAPEDLISDALLELGIGAAGETLQPEQVAQGLNALQRRIDLINAQKRLIYAVNFEVFTTPANTQPIPIGPGQTFNVPDAPVFIESANWILPGTNGDVDLPPMRILTDSEWAQVTIKNLTNTLPTSLYYSRGASVGNIYLLPIPTVSEQIRLQLWSSLSQAIDDTTAIGLPPGYWMYLVCALASDLAPSYGQEFMAIVQSEPFMLKYREARSAITANNSGAPPLQSDVPSNRQRSNIPDYNFLTGIRGSR